MRAGGAGSWLVLAMSAAGWCVGRGGRVYTVAAYIRGVGTECVWCGALPAEGQKLKVERRSYRTFRSDFRHDRRRSYLSDRGGVYSDV